MSGVPAIANNARNIKLLIEYEGTNYHGWQLQPGLETIQGILQNGLAIITKSDVEVVGSGRTDAGVHALGQVANFKTGSRMTPEEFKAALNSLLPKDIVIRDAQEVEDDFHARYSAISRTYEYTILNSTTPSVFLRNYTYQVHHPIDIDVMNDACESLLGTRDFSSFASSSDPVYNLVRTVYSARCRESLICNPEFGEVSALAGNCRGSNSPWYSDAENAMRLIRFRIEANAFLRGMVRAIVGTLLEIGTGKTSPEKMKEILEAKSRSSAGPSLPARGLCLIKVNYAQ